jgi:predicted NAD/FAD-dependent oxidoreductase
LVPEVAVPGWRSVTCVQWAAPKSPLGGEPVLWLNGTGRGRINNLVVPSDVAAGYALAGAALVSTTIIGECKETDAELLAQLRAELAARHGALVKDWRALAVQRIRCALPVLSPGSGAAAARPVREGLWVCGDHCASASIQGAMAAGQAVGEALAASP